LIFPAAQLTEAAEVIVSLFLGGTAAKGIFDTIKSVLKERIYKANLDDDAAVVATNVEKLKSVSEELKHLEKTVDSLIRENEDLNLKLIREESGRGSLD
jgi:hypothetical protein